MYKVLTIAGSDCSGGAGIQADIKTITAHKMYAMSVITALTAQNTRRVMSILEVTPSMVADQLDCIFEDIRPDAVKIGMVSNPLIIDVIVDRLIKYKAENIVVDPVMVSTSGSTLLKQEAIERLVNKLFPIAGIITPNIAEAEVLANRKINNKPDMLLAAEEIAKTTKSRVLLKGGHLSNDVSDLLYTKEKQVWFSGVRHKNINTHGTGCTLSSAIACNLASGKTIEESVGAAKQYVSGAIAADLNLGQGAGPLNHMYCL